MAVELQVADPLSLIELHAIVPQAAEQVFVCATYHDQHCALRKLTPATTHRKCGRNVFW